MRDLFPEFIRLEEPEFKQLWEEAIFIFDTNVLLSLYRLPENARKKLLSAFKKLGNRVWIPNQVALEFYRNRYEVIHEKEKVHVEFADVLKTLEEEIKKHFDTKTLVKKITQKFDALNKEIVEAKSKHCDWKKEDVVESQLNLILKGKVGLPYDPAKLAEIYSKGEDRYNKDIPPGYQDRSKDKNDKTKTKKFGDLIVWNQIIDKAKNEHKPIIFVTDDQKDDWWWKINKSTTIGARYELKKEITKEADVMFHMYQSDGFVKYASEYLKDLNFDQALVDQVKKTKETTQNNNASTSSEESQIAGYEESLEELNFKAPEVIEEEDSLSNNDDDKKDQSSTEI